MKDEKRIGCWRVLARVFGAMTLAIAALSLCAFVTVVISDTHKSGFSFTNVFSWLTTLLLIGVMAAGGLYFWKLGGGPGPS